MEILRKKIKGVILIILFSYFVIFISCENLLLGPEPKNTPKDNFEMFWKDFDRYYALFGVKKVDWQKSHDHYIHYINDNSTGEELWYVLSSMIDTLHDAHASIQMGTDGLVYVSGEHGYNIDFDVNVIKNNYLNNNYKITGNGNIIYAVIPDHSIGYIYISTFGDEIQANQITEAVNYLRPLNSIIIDIRENLGGKVDNMQTVASAFIDHPITYLKETTRSGPGHNDFEPWTFDEVFPMVNFEIYNKKIVLLINNRSMSMSDRFAYLFKNYISNATLIGTNTKGSFSLIFNFRILPNGWIYTFSSRLTTSLDGVALDSTGGVKPDIYFDNEFSTPFGIDSVLITAINYLDNN